MTTKEFAAKYLGYKRTT